MSLHPLPPAPKATTRRRRRRRCRGRNPRLPSQQPRQAKPPATGIRARRETIISQDDEQLQSWAGTEATTSRKSSSSRVAAQGIMHLLPLSFMSGWRDRDDHRGSWSCPRDVSSSRVSSFACRMAPLGRRTVESRMWHVHGSSMDHRWTSLPVVRAHAFRSPRMIDFFDSSNEITAGCNPARKGTRLTRKQRRWLLLIGRAPLIHFRVHWHMRL